VLVLAIIASPAQGATTTHVLDARISQGDAGHPGNGTSDAFTFGISADGQVVAFDSADVLVAGDTDPGSDLFVRDGSSLVELTSPTQNHSFSDVHVLPSGDVLFQSDDPLGTDADGGLLDYFLYKRGGGLAGLKEISGPPTGAGTTFGDAVVSADGSMIAFTSSANLPPESDAGDTDVYAWSAAAGTSSPTLVTAGNARSGSVRAISRDGAKIFYESDQAVGSADGGVGDVFVGTPGGGVTENLSDFASLNGEGGIDYTGSSPDGGSVAFTTTNQLVASDVNGAQDLYENNHGTLEWVTMPGTGATPGPSPAGPVGAVCNGGSAIFSTAARLVGADPAPGLTTDLYRHPAGAGTSPQLLTGTVSGATFLGASNDCNRVAVATTDSLGGLGGGSPGVDDAFLITGTTPSRIAFDIVAPYGAGPDLTTLFFQSATALVGEDGDSVNDGYLWRASDGSLELLTATPGSSAQAVTAATPDATFVIDETTQHLGDGDSDNKIDLFRLKARQPLTVTPAGTGSGTVESSPAGISCGAACSVLFDHGTSVTLTATPSTGSVFTGWSGACLGTGTCTVTLDAPKDATATFDLVPDVPDGDGTPDTVAPNQTLGGKKMQDVDKLAVTDTVSESATVQAQATISLPTAHKKSVKSKAITVQANTGQSLKLRLKFSKGALRKLKGALADGEHLKAKVAVTATDAAGNGASASQKVKLKDG
jgi:Divergent InlB B-repeat domain/WD40-like Beta Propeller Repeat